jgi:CubicO group peptidase (beta-lactamase class C family)
MNSGYDWVEHYYSWFSPTVELYHGSDIEGFLLGRGFSDSPSERWYYSSASTQLLGIALRRALAAGGREISLSQYLSEKIWQPLGMNDDALWHLDSSGMEMVFCCINSNARNFARLGLLMLNNGEWQGQQIVPQAFIQKMIQPDGQDHYGYSTWLNYTNEPPFYHFSGHLGQSISVIPEHRLVVVRLGERRDESKDFQTEELPAYITEALRLSADSSATLTDNIEVERQTIAD